MMSPEINDTHSQSISPTQQLSDNNNHNDCERFDEILKKVEERNSEGSSFSESGQPFNSSGELENSTLSSFTQLMTHSFTSSFDALTGSISDNNNTETYLRDKPNLFLDSLKPP
ncbi:hypothetical protein, partial [Salmonella sp. s51228]|uniref:hypothetical protein n=1 Tax=Salmonella sp. s51228 TaxID=3159652 RepID=UPI0039814E02